MPEQLTIEPSLVEAELRRRRQASEASERAEIERELAAKAARELELAEHRAVVDQGVAEGKAALEEAKPLLATAGRLIGELGRCGRGPAGPKSIGPARSQYAGLGGRPRYDHPNYSAEQVVDRR